MTNQNVQQDDSEETEPEIEEGEEPEEDDALEADEEAETDDDSADEEYEEDDDVTLLDDEVMIGEYANYAAVGSTQTEFYLDFFHVVPGSGTETTDEQVLPVRRIMISPMLVRGLVRALEQEVSNYEATYKITLPTVES